MADNGNIGNDQLGETDLIDSSPPLPLLKFSVIVLEKVSRLSYQKQIKGIFFLEE